MHPNNPIENPLELRELRVQALLEEYRALYSLVLFRFAALDRRIPVAGVTLTAFLGSVTVVPANLQTIVFVGVPLALVWVVRTTINHARSCEDALRRIEQIEQGLNALLQDRVIGFQSAHPSRGTDVGGRTATETIAAVLTGATLLLVACVYLSVHSGLWADSRGVAYAVFILCVVMYLA